MFCSFFFFFQKKMSWNIGSYRNNFLSLRNKSKVFHLRLHYELKKSSDTVLEALNYPKNDKFIHNGLLRTTLIYQSDAREISISQHRCNRVQWSFLTKTEIKTEEYKKILDPLSELPSYVETFKKTSITLDKSGRKFDGHCHTLKLFQSFQ